MAMDLDLKIEKMLLSKARLILSMDKKTREKVLYRLCRQKLLPHIHSVTKSGWYYVDGTDKYSPYNSKQYVVFAIIMKDIVVQLVADFDDNEIYFTYYIPKQSAWYRWKNYDFKKRETNIKSSAIPVRGKTHILENASKPCLSNMTDSCIISWMWIRKKKLK